MATPSGMIGTFLTANESRDRIFVSKPDKIINDAIRRTMTLPHFWGGELAAESVRHGDVLRERILLSYTSTFRAASSRTKWTWQNTESGTNIESTWAQYANYFAFSMEEKAFAAAKNYTAQAQARALKDIMHQKEQVCYTDHLEGLDDLFWARPNPTTMESPAVGIDAESFSIPVFVNEGTDGLLVDSGTGGNGNFSTVVGVDPANQAEWRNKRQSYTSNALTNANTGVIAGMNALARQINYNVGKLPMGANKYTEQDVGPRNPFRIFTSPAGLDQFEQALFAVGDYLSARGDGVDGRFADAAFKGTKLIDIEKLTTAEIYPAAGNVLAGEAGAVVKFPRYFMINTDYMKMLYHADYLMKKTELKVPTDRIGAYIQPGVSWVQLWCDSRRRHGCLYPIAA